MVVSAKILVVDDDEKFLKSMQKLLRLKSYVVDTVADPLEVEDLVENNNYRCILLDVTMPVLSGSDLLKTILRRHTSIPVIMISGQSSIKTAVQSIKDGAYDFVEKPIDHERLFVAIKNAVQKKTLQEEKDTVLQALQEKFQMVAKSSAMKEIFQEVEKVANTPAKVLILGESGTGKELLAFAIHHNSDRKAKPYVKLNCAAIPSELLESEIFGHRKGSFTGAVAEHSGKFIAADGGTLFLDEIGDMSVQLQAKLLRVLENNEVEVVGENFARKVDVRIIAATNQKLEELVARGSFRSDLYHRLNVVKIVIPPLRERPEDLLPLAHHFLGEFNDAYNKQVLSFKRQASALLVNYHWPGNVRELRNVMEKLVIFSRGKEVGIEDVQKALAVNRIPGHEPLSIDENEITSLRNANRHFEKEYILTALRKYDWKIQDTANALGIDRSNLFKKMRKHGIHKS